MQSLRKVHRLPAQRIEMSEPQSEIRLRPYQTESIDGVHDLMRGGHKRIVLVPPTGAG